MVCLLLAARGSKLKAIIFNTIKDPKWYAVQEGDPCAIIGAGATLPDCVKQAGMMTIAS